MAGLKNVQDQVKDRCKKLYHTKIELATQKQLALELKTDLQRVMEVARTVEEAVKASK